MSPLYTILFLNILQQFIPLIAKTLTRIFCSLQYRRENAAEDKLRAELHELQHEQQKISMMDEFAKHARMQRKIDKLKDDIKVKGRSKSTSYHTTKLLLTYGLQFVVGVIFLYICVCYRYNAVAYVSQEWTSYLAYVLAFPSGELGTVSCIFWMLSCRASVRFISDYFSKNVVQE